MESSTLSKKAKTHKGRLHQNSLLAKLIEDPKECLFINTKNTNEIMQMVLSDLYVSRKMFSKKLSRKNKFESVFKDATSIEYFSEKNNTALFTYTTDGQRKPMNLVVGSLFNNKILDMFEYEVTNFIPMEYFAKFVKIHSSMKPVVIFQGDIFETDFQFDRIRKYFLDYFKLNDSEEFSIDELRRVIIISSGDDKIIKIRAFQVEGPIKEFNLNDINLTEIGPSLDLKVRQVHLASTELYNLSLKQPKEIKDRKVKNIEKNLLGEKRGRIHMSKQNLKTAALKNYKKILGKKRFGKENPEDEKKAKLKRESRVKTGKGNREKKFKSKNKSKNKSENEFEK